MVLPGNLARILDRATKRLATVQEHPPPEQAVSGELEEIIETIRATVPVAPQEQAPAESPQERTPAQTEDPTDEPEEASAAGIPALAAAVRRTDLQVAQIFKDAANTFRAYEPGALQTPEFTALRLSVWARYAETLYRMGRPVRARRLWNAMLSEDRLDANVLRNLAVCDTHGVSFAQCLTSWKAYLEMLCFLDVVSGNPRDHAADRHALHLALGDSYAPSCFVEELTPDWEKQIDKGAMASFMGNASRIRHFVRHRFWTYLNAHLRYASPALTLGTKRSDSQAHREAARERLIQFAQAQAEHLPARVRSAFMDTIVRHAQTALDTCAVHEKMLLTKDPDYPAQEKDHLHLLKDFANLKRKMFIAIRNHEDLVETVPSLEILGLLREIDTLPLNLSEDFAATTAAHVGMDKESLCEIMKHLSHQLVVRLMRYLLACEGNAEDRKRCVRQYRLLIRELKRTDLLADCLELVDNAPNFFPARVVDDLNSPPLSADTKALLKRAVEDYPAFSAVVCLYVGRVLAEEDEYEQAAALLHASAAESLSDKGKQECLELAEKIEQGATANTLNAALESQDFDTAIATARSMVEDDSEHVVRPQNLVVIYNNAAQATGEDPGSQEMVHIVDAWIARAQGNVSEQDIEQLVQARDQCLVQIVLAANGAASGKPDWPQVAQGMTELLAANPEIDDARFYRMRARYNHAGELSQAANPDRDRVRRHLGEARVDAEWVVANDDDPEHVKQAEQIIERIDEVL